VLAGVAGGLRDTPRCPAIGKVVDRAGRWWRPSLEIAWPGDEERYTVVGVDAPVCHAAEKPPLAAACRADLVDCESHAFAEWCDGRALPWAVCRAVSDGPGDSLPREVASWVDDRGRTRAARVAGSLVVRPWRIGVVRALGVRTRLALEALAERVSALVESAR
ncbi:MAG: hypothetical protein IBJ11_07485, partial [Phycisphaerales bacterium]|nr:hypothetical protein [Phycisphaerales bacterium]